MLKDANPGSFAGIYIVCGYTDMRYGIDSLAAIIEQKYKMNLFIPNTLFLFCGHCASKIKVIIPARGNRASGRTETVCPERGNHRYASLLA